MNEWMSSFGCISYIYLTSFFETMCCHRECVAYAEKLTIARNKRMEKWMEKNISNGAFDGERKSNEDFNKCCITFWAAMLSDMLGKILYIISFHLYLCIVFFCVGACRAQFIHTCARLFLASSVCESSVAVYFISLLHTLELRGKT